jgi:hypothetical protein
MFPPIPVEWKLVVKHLRLTKKVGHPLGSHYQSKRNQRTEEFLVSFGKIISIRSHRVNRIATHYPSNLL